jgi:rod shape determining protein RodA
MAGDLLRRPVLEADHPAGGAGHRAVAAGGVLRATLCADGFRWPVLHDYQQQRICTLLDPTKDPLGKGFHIIQGMIAIGSGACSARASCRARRRTSSSSPSAPPTSSSRLLGGVRPAGQPVPDRSFLFLVLRGLAIASRLRRCSRGCWPAR